MYIYLYIYFHVWEMEKSPQAKGRLWVVHMPSCAGLCRTMPGLAAQRSTNRFLSLVGALITMPTLNLSQHRGSCYNDSATLVSSIAAGAIPASSSWELGCDLAATRCRSPTNTCDHL